MQQNILEVRDLCKYYPGVNALNHVTLAFRKGEGHTIIQKGRTNIRYFVKDYEAVRFELF